MRSVTLATACVLAGFAMADTEFPNVDSSGDLASPAAWGVSAASEIPTTDKVVFKTSGLTYTASSDITFAGFEAQSQNATAFTSFTFDMRPDVASATAENPRTITLTNNFTRPYGRTTVKIRGGVWDFQHKGMVYMPRDGKPYARFEINDGAVVTNLSNFCGGSYLGAAVGATNSIAGASRVYTRQLFAEGENAQSSVLEVIDGSKLYVDGENVGNYARIGVAKNTTGDNLTRVAGEGSLLSISRMKSAPNIFFNGTGNQLIVEDNGTLELKQASYWAVNGSGHSVKIMGGGKVASDNQIYFPYGGNGGNSFEVLEDGTLQTWKFSMGGSRYPNNVLVISNGTYSGGAPEFANNTAGSNNVVRIIGPKAKFNPTRTGRYGFFQAGPYCGYEVDGASWTNQYASCFSLVSTGTHHSWFELRNNADLYWENDFAIGPASYVTPSNEVRVLSGSCLSAGYINTSSVGNSFVVSNATMVSRGTSGVVIGADSSAVGVYGNSLVLKGVSPRVSAANGPVTLQNESRLVFAPSEEFYDEDVVPVTAENVTISENSSIEFEGLDACISNLENRKTRKLIAATSTLTIPENVLSAAQSSLPAGARLYLTDSGKSLAMTISSSKGLMLIFR